MTDNPVSWLALLFLAVIVGVWLAKKAFDEIEERKGENDNRSDWGK